MRKTRYYLNLSSEEHRQILHADLWFRNQALTRGTDTADLDQLIGRIQRRKVWWC